VQDLPDVSKKRGGGQNSQTPLFSLIGRRGIEPLIY